MSNIAQDLRTLITGSTAVTALVGTRVHYNKLPESSARPHVWFRVVSDTEDLTLDGTGGLHAALADVECAGLTEDSTQSVADAIKSRLHGYKGTTGGSSVKAIFVQDKDDQYVPFSTNGDDGVHVIAYGLRLWYST